MKSTPLRALALASEGRFSFAALESMVHLLSGRPLRALAASMRRRRS
jgi:hypothetical protein